MSAAEKLELERQGGVATFWLNRPAVRNAFDEALIANLTAGFERIAQDGEVRVVVLAGRGRAFCAGGDLSWMERLATMSAADNRADADRLAGMFRAIEQCPQPTVARVHGACFAGALGLVAACDFAVAAADARFCFSEVRIGLVPATIGPYVVRAIGTRAATRLMLTAETFDADAALRLGLVHSVVGADELDAAVAALAGSLLAGAPAAQATTKRLMHELAGRPIDASVLRATAECIAAARASAEGREGVRAVLEKRVPEWRGRRGE